MTRRRNLAPPLHHLAALALLSTQMPTLVTAEDLDAEDVPPECDAACAPIVQLTERCEAQTEQRFGDVGKRWDPGLAWSSPAKMPAKVPLGKRRRRKRRVSEVVRARRRQAGEEDSDSDSDEEGSPPPAVVAAAGQAERDCVCGERGFDVFGVMSSCAACMASNPTAVGANEDIKEIMAQCGFNPVYTTAPAPPAANPAAPPSGSSVLMISTMPPAFLAPEIPSSLSTSTSTSTPAPPPPVVQTSTQPPAVETPTQPPELAASPTPDRSITPVTVFETPSFRTLPSLALPNDFAPPRSDVESGGGWSSRRLSLLGRVSVVLMVVWIMG